MRNRFLYARRGITSAFGKCMDALGTLRLHSETAESVKQEAARLGLPVMEYVREFLEVGHHGRSEVERRHIIRLDAIESLQPKRHRKESTE